MASSESSNYLSYEFSAGNRGNRNFLDMSFLKELFHFQYSYGSAMNAASLRFSCESFALLILSL